MSWFKLKPSSTPIATTKILTVGRQGTEWSVIEWNVRQTHFKRIATFPTEDEARKYQRELSLAASATQSILSR